MTLRRRDGALAVTELELRAAPRQRTAVAIGSGCSQRCPWREVAADRQPAAQTAGEPGSRGTDAFLSWLNHELRSPLNACAMWVDVLALAPQPDKLVKAVEAIKRNSLVKRGSSMISTSRQSLLGRPRDAARAVDLVGLLKRDLDAWQLLAIAKQLTLQHRIEPRRRGLLEADPERLCKL